MIADIEVIAGGLRFTLMVAGATLGLLGLKGWDRNGTEHMWGLWALANGCAAVCDGLGGDWPWFAWDIALTALCAYWWLQEHRKRKDRRKALAALGAKSKALRDALVRKARESARPSPVLRPSLGGAR